MALRAVTLVVFVIGLLSGALLGSLTSFVSSGSPPGADMSQCPVHAVLKDHISIPSPWLFDSHCFR